MVKKQFFILLLVVSMPVLHEFGHYIGYYIDDITATISYSVIYYESSSKAFYGIIGGPLFNISLSTITLILSYINNSNTFLWSSISFASSFNRLLVNILILFISIFNNKVLLYNDEGKISNLLGLPSYFMYLLSIIIYIFLILKLFKNVKSLDIFKDLTIHSIIFIIILVFLQN